MNNDFGNVIWTNHALQRLKERGISQSDAWATWSRPEQSRYAQSKGAWVFYRTYNGEKIEVVSKKNEKGQWIILSVWSRKVEESRKTESFLSFLLRKIFKKRNNKK